MTAARGLIVALAVLAGGLALACDDNGGGGNGGSSALEQYFFDLEAVDAAFEEDGAQADQDFIDAANSATDDAAALEVYRQSFAEFGQIIEEFINDFDALDPPPEAAQAHDDAITAGRDVVAIFDDLVAQAQGVATATEAEDLANELLNDEAFGRLDTACIELQGIADEHDIDIDLECEQ